MALGCGEERPEFVGRPRGPFGVELAGAGLVGQAGDVALHDALAFGVADGLADDPVDSQHGLGRERSAVHAAFGHEGAVEAFEVERRELGELHVADVRSDVAAGLVAVVADRSGLHVGAGQTVEPQVEVLEEGHVLDVEEVPAHLDGSSCFVECCRRFGLGGEATLVALASTAGLGVVAEVDDVLPEGAAVTGRVLGDSGLASRHRSVLEVRAMVDVEVAPSPEDERDDRRPITSRSLETLVERPNSSTEAGHERGHRLGRSGRTRESPIPEKTIRSAVGGQPGRLSAAAKRRGGTLLG